MLAKDVRQLASAHFLWKLLPTITEGTRILKLDAWNEAYHMPYRGGLASKLAACGPTTVVDKRVDLVQAAQMFAPKATCLAADWADLPFDAGSFDLIVNCFSTEEWTGEDMQPVDEELRRVLAVGGRIATATRGDCVYGKVKLRDRNGVVVTEYPPVAVIAMQEGRAVFDGVVE